MTHSSQCQGISTILVSITVVGDVCGPHDVVAVVAVVEDVAVKLPDDDVPQAHVRGPWEVGRGRRIGNYST